jgi:hypothetical protein
MDLLSVFLVILFSIVSLILGFYIGNNLKKKDHNKKYLIEEKTNIRKLDEKKQLIESLLSELFIIKEILLIGLQPTADLRGVPRQWLPRRLSTNIMDSAINSGRFILLSSVNQASLTSFYEDVKHLNTLGSNAGVMHFQELHARSVDIMTSTIEKMLNSFNQLICQLKAENVNS